METETEVRSVVDQTIDKLRDMIAVLETMREVMPDTVSFGVDISQGINVWPNNHDEARRIVGGLIRLFKGKPEIRKWAGTELEANFTFKGVTVRVNKYRGRKCAMVKREIVHAAVPETITPAKAAYVEFVEELVCEMDDVEQEAAAQVPVEA